MKVSESVTGFKRGLDAFRLHGYQAINELRGKKRREIKPNFVINNERVINRRIIANEFNKYFASIGGGVTSVYVRLSHRIQKGQDIGGHRRT